MTLHQQVDLRTCKINQATGSSKQAVTKIFASSVQTVATIQPPIHRRSARNGKEGVQNAHETYSRPLPIDPTGTVEPASSNPEEKKPRKSQ